MIKDMCLSEEYGGTILGINIISSWYLLYMGQNCIKIG